MTDNEIIKTADKAVLLKRARSEAIKEFAERVKQEFDKYRLEYKEVMNDDGACAMIIAKKGIDIVLKESGCE